jgi:iron-sulfur cluster protein
MNRPPSISTESPRAIADKRTKKILTAAIRMALRVESPAVRHNTQTFNRGRYAAIREIADYNELKRKTRSIKEDAIARLPGLVALLEESVLRNGGHFFFAKNAEEARRYIADVCQRARAKLVVKGKSITSEEIGLNRELESRGIEVAESDLAEFILQVADEQPSHIIAPAIHYSRERISELFRRVFRTDRKLETGEELTEFARDRLREKFLAADAGITGANFIAADSGSLVLVESEGNIRMSYSVPRLHIAVAGVEKIVPSRADFAPFLELLAASATGQRMSAYTSVITPPLVRAPVLSDSDDPHEAHAQHEFHLVVIDNGRLTMREDPVLREALYCIRCSACLNSCANFQTVGGHAFGGDVYSGGIGGAWTAGTEGIEHARFSELCTGCSRCVPQCPVKIDIPWLNTVLRERLLEQESSPAALLESAFGAKQTEPATLEKLFFGHFDVLAKNASRAAGILNFLGNLSPARWLMEKLVGLDHRRALPKFAKPTLVEGAKQRFREPVDSPRARAVLFADIFTNYNWPERGIATLRVLRELGVDVVVSPPLADGRAALSQGLIATATEQAAGLVPIFEKYVAEGREIVVVEPSVLAMFRMDYRHLLKGPNADRTLEMLRAHTFDPIEYLQQLLPKIGLASKDVFDALECPRGTRVFFHSHCQQKTTGAAEANAEMLRSAGFDVVTSRVECCGMAGSFGYKKDFYDLSMAVGRDLFIQVEEAESDGPRILCASGISCQEQLAAGMNRAVFHPMQLLADTLDVRPRVFS